MSVAAMNGMNGPSLPEALAARAQELIDGRIEGARRELGDAHAIIETVIRALEAHEAHDEGLIYQAMVLAVAARAVCGAIERLDCVHIQRDLRG